ncbi:MAG: AAA family ATPase [Candidatus Verstraetearchaeota archaeon]|nr:AAA family ATPase [Candidatus Verstraetearchaeota archaeon]
MKAKAIAIQAAGVTGTGIGKSLTVALLCRLFSEDGYKVAPFKALNLTNVVYRDSEGREFGYSQALQAIAAGIEPDYRMNPFTPKPLGNGEFELILEGRVIERYSMSLIGLMREGVKMFAHVNEFYNRIMSSIESCLHYLMSNYDIVCIEGTGPSKVLGIGFLSKLLDIPNMWIAKLASAPVILLTSSIDSAAATYHYLSEEERGIVKGVIINRFQQRDLRREIVEEMGVPEGIFKYGVRKVEETWLKTLSIPIEVLGEIPYLEELSKIPPLDPLFSRERVNLDEWKEIIPKIARKVRKSIDMGKLYKLMGI